jgi:hypothetical protein
LFVYHNEAPETTFHPKVYLFQNDTDAKLIVGSNNLTEAGLFVNTEAGLEIEAPVKSSLIQDAVAAVVSWRDPAMGLALPLNDELLEKLVEDKYVFSERAIRRRRASIRGKHAEASATRVLFGRQSVTVPAKQRIFARQGRLIRRRPPADKREVGRVLLMRVRKASETDRPTQTQVPKAVFEDAFFVGVTAIVSSHDGRSHGITRARARGIVNTLKLEIPEMRDFRNPVIRLERTATGMQYEAYDADSLLGRPILAALEVGRTMRPRATRMTKPSAPDTSTWWRFI